MKLKIDKSIYLNLIEDEDAIPLFELASRNRLFLEKWLPWLDDMDSLLFIQNFIRASKLKHKNGLEHAFVIFFEKEMVGRIGLYKIDPFNRIAELGYWISEDFEGKGIMTKSAERLLTFAFSELNVNRVEIRCGEHNLSSQKIPKRLGFVQEGLLREAELIRGKYINHILYSKLKSEYLRQD